MAARTTVALTVLSQLGVAALYLLCRNFVGYTFSSDPEVVATFAAVIPIAALFQVPPSPSILLPHACVSVRVCERAWLVGAPNGRPLPPHTEQKHTHGALQVFDGLQSACAGAFRGMGRNALVAWLNFIGLWVIGQTLGVVLAFFVGTPLSPPSEHLVVRERGIGVYGLWWGLAAGLGCTSLTGLYILARRTDWPEMARQAQCRSAIGGGGRQGGGRGGDGAGREARAR